MKTPPETPPKTVPKVVPLPRASDQRSGVKPKAPGDQQFDPKIIWATVRHCWAWAVPMGVVLAGLAALFVIETFEPRYLAKHLLVANNDYLAFKGVMPVVKNLARSETPIMLNAITLDSVLAESRFRSAPSLSDPDSAALNLRRYLKVRGAGDPSQLIVSYEDSTPEAAALVCNGIVSAYLAKRDAFDRRRVANWERQLNPEIAKWQAVVGSQQAKVTKLHKQVFGFAPGDQSSVSEAKNELSNANRMRVEISNLELEIFVEKAKMAMQAERESQARDSENSVAPVDPRSAVRWETPSEFEINRLVGVDPEVATARNIVSSYGATFRELESRRGVRLDLVRRAEARLDKAKTRLAEVETEVEARILEKLNKLADQDYYRRKADETAQAKFDRQIFEQEQNRNTSIVDGARLETLKTKLSFLKGQIDLEIGRTENFGTATAELKFAEGELNVANSVLEKLTSRAAAVRTERNQEGAVVSLAAATPPRTPIEELPYKKLGLMSAGAFLIPFLFGLLLEVRTKRLTDTSMCDKNGLSVIGEIARLSSGPRGQSSKGRRVFEESFDSLRSRLSLSMDTKDARSIAVVSSMTGEGKSSVSSQLALSIARSTGETVLLVDADLRCPDQHDIFGVDLGPGLSAVLDNKVSAAEAIDKSLGEFVHLLPAGRLSSSPHKLITAEKMKSFVEEALKEYRYVVIDTAPVLAAGETLAIASVTDISLLCVMRDVSRVDSVARTTRRLEAAGARVAGTVFSGVSTRQYSYRYGSYDYGLLGADVKL